MLLVDVGIAVGATNLGLGSSTFHMCLWVATKIPTTPIIQNIMRQCTNVLAPCLKFYPSNTQSNQKLWQQPKPKVKHTNKIIPNP